MSAVHLRYGHRCRPRDLHVACPRCGSRALAVKPSEHGSGAIVGDLAGTWHLADWSVRCGGCAYRADGLAFEGLPPLYYTFDVGALTVWAWSHAHLEMLGLFLSGRSVAQHPLWWMQTYVPGEWKKKRHRSALGRAIQARQSAALGG
jgi:hypothetical protein